jgi:outer membrane protein assembly factor BamB
VFFGTEGGVAYCVNWRKAETVWTYRTDKGNQSFRSSPAVTDNAVVIGSRSKQVVCLAPSTGELRWAFPTRQRVDSSPVIVGSRVYVGSADDRLYGIDLASGQKVWEFEGRGGFNSSPAVAGDKLVIASDEGVVYCFGRK